MILCFVLILCACLRADIVDDLIHHLEEELRSEEKVAEVDAVPAQTLMDTVSFEVVGDGFCRDSNGRELKKLKRALETISGDIHGKNGPCALLCANYAECKGYAVSRFLVNAGFMDNKEYNYACYAYGDFKHTPPLWTLQSGSVDEPAQGGGKGTGQDAKCKKIIRHPIRAPIKAACGAGQVIKKMENGDESCVKPGSINWSTAPCTILRPSLNGRKFGYGCKGAVWSDGSVSQKYCEKESWYNRCCEYNRSGINGRHVIGQAACIQKIDCRVWPLRNFFNDVAPKLAPEMGPCSWAVWSDGTMNNNYCDGRATDNWRSYIHPWFQKCCRDDNEAITTPYGNSRTFYCRSQRTWPRKEGQTYYEY